MTTFSFAPCDDVMCSFQEIGQGLGTRVSTTIKLTAKATMGQAIRHHASSRDTFGERIHSIPSNLPEMHIHAAHVAGIGVFLYLLAQWSRRIRGRARQINAKSCFSRQRTTESSGLTGIWVQ